MKMEVSVVVMGLWARMSRCGFSAVVIGPYGKRVWPQGLVQEEWSGAVEEGLW